MQTLTSRPPLWPAARITFVAALSLFVITIVVGILNGLDVYLPDHDTLITHVHAGTLGWITLASSGIALLMFSSGRELTDSEVGQGKALAWAMTAAIALYVAAFFAGDRIPGDRIQRPIFGTLLFLVVIWFVVWLFRSNGAYARSSVARLGMLLAWLSMLVGAVFGVVLGIYSSQGEVPGLGDETASAIAESHPPAMVIGFLVLAALAIIEWLLRDEHTWAESKWGAAQMWILFVAGLVVVLGFVTRLEEELLPPANLLMVAGIVILVVRSWSNLMPDGWRGAGTGIYPRLAILFTVAYLVLLTIIIVLVVSGEMEDFENLTDAQFGLALTFDHVMFIGVMTNLLFGVIASQLHGSSLHLVDRILLWGVNLGIVGFGIGLITVSPVVKRIATPIMGTALLIGIVLYIMEMTRSEVPASAET